MAPLLTSRAVAIATIAALAAISMCAPSLAYSPQPRQQRRTSVASVGNNSNRRAFLSKVASSFPAVVGGFGGITAASPDAAFAAAPAAATKDSLLADLKASKEKLAPIPDMLKNEQWDPVRTLLKTPPVNQLWNLGESQNTLVKLAKETGEFDLIELKDELAISLQMCDQYTYDNAFVYFQPGNGKVKLKEPTDMAIRAMKQIQEAIDIVG